MAAQKITVSAEIQAGIDKVWNRWTEPAHIVNWNFASEDWHCPAAENDLRPGGRFSSTMASRDGKMSFDFSGIYDAVEDRRRIAYTMGDGRQVEILFEDLGDDRTRVTEHFDAESTHSAEMQRAGWQAIMDNFGRYVEAS